PRNAKRTPVDIYDEDGSRHHCENGDLLGELFSNSPVYYRETPPEYNANGVRCGLAFNGERIVRCFGDYETALEKAEDIWSWDTNSAAALRQFLASKDRPQDASIAASEALFAEVDRKINLDTLLPQFLPSVCGGAPRVGAFLAGQPDSMLRSQTVLDAQGAVRVFVDLSTSSSTADQARIGRSAAILALVRVIQRLRPVELWVTTSGTARRAGQARCHTLFGLRVSAAPFDLQTASTALCNPRMRDFCYRGEMRLIGAKLGETTRLSWSDIPYAVKAGATDNDICIGPHRDNLKNSISPNHSPVDWVKREVELWLTRSGQSAALASLALAE
nr:hypothetical protein [bacterium]